MFMSYTEKVKVRFDYTGVFSDIISSDDLSDQSADPL